MQSSAHFILARSWRLASGRVDRVATRPEVTIHWLLRIGCAMCFVGHGAWGVITKSGWVPLYGVFGIPASLAWKTMPVIGAVDITFGALVLFFPFRALFGYMALWTLLTALLRPLAGLGVWEFLERAGNYGPPIALFIVASQRNGHWLERVEARPLSPEILRRVAWVLRISIALLLVGHGGFALIQEKKILVDQWQSIGVPAGRTFLHVLGIAEMGAAIAVLCRPSRWLLLVIGYWKIASELLYPVSGKLRDVWEWLERGGDYVTPLALLCLLALLHSRSGDRGDGTSSTGADGGARTRGRHHRLGIVPSAETAGARREP
jgi:hypothetical protein